MTKIETFDFNLSEIETIRKKKYGEKWPVVYFIHNENEAYIGETTNVYVRSSQHIKNPLRKKLHKIHVISDDEFNKSAIMDIESALIKYVSADNKFKLQNLNSGLQNHDYYQKDHYQEKIFRIWEKLQNKKIVNSSLRSIENSDLFKYSPYKSLTTDQYFAVDFILQILAENFYENKSFVMNGSAGTGKTVLAVYLIKLLKSFEKSEYVLDEEQDINYISYISDILKQKSSLKIGLVVPQVSLRKTLKQVFRNVHGLSPNMVLGPSDVVKEKYDILFVDEAHRLKRRINITNFDSYDKNNRRLGIDKESTELDWIIQQSSHQIFFYDQDQSIRPSDVRKEGFENLMFSKSKNIVTYQLKSQLRCLGGNDYVEYVKSIFSIEPPKEKIVFSNYEFKIYDNIKDMINKITINDGDAGLSRVLAGYAWKWKTKGKSLDEIQEKSMFDFEIEGLKLVWNSTNQDWVNSKNAINEVGCIHTTQGYDLNYAGVIIGNELSYDSDNQCLIIKKENYFDSNGYRGIKDIDELKKYILNIYQTLLLRGIKGTYIYVCDQNLKDYLKKYIDFA